MKRNDWRWQEICSRMNVISTVDGLGDVLLAMAQEIDNLQDKVIYLESEIMRLETEKQDV